MRSSLSKLDAYVISRQFLIALDKALAKAPRSRDVTQAKDAAASVMRNIAEANVTTGADKARRFQLALLPAWRSAGARSHSAARRPSRSDREGHEASECTACLDILQCRGALGGTELEHLVALNDRQRATLWPLSRKR